MDKILPSIDKDAISPARFKKNVANSAAALDDENGVVRVVAKVLSQAHQ